MKKNVVLAIALAGALASNAAAPTASNVRFTRTSGANIEITYDLDMDAVVTLELKTNGVPVETSNYPSLSGNGWGRVRAGSDRKILWKARKDWPDQDLANVTAAVTAWSLDVPPPYMVVCLTNSNNVSYYASAEAVPFGVTNRMYKTSHIVLAKIPAAGRNWLVGAPAGQNTSTESREVQHFVAFSDDFYAGIYEFTGGQWLKFKDTNPASKHPYADKDYCPVETVALSTIRGGATSPFAAAPDSASVLGMMRSRTGIAFDLPTHAQWEVACRGGIEDNYINVAGATINEVAWSTANWSSDPAKTAIPYTAACTHEVGLLLPNAFGLYDTLGNVQEIGLDWLFNTPKEAYVTAIGFGATLDNYLDIVWFDTSCPSNRVTGASGTTYNPNAASDIGRWGGSFSEANTNQKPTRWAGYGLYGQNDTGFRVICPAKNGGWLNN